MRYPKTNQSPPSDYAIELPKVDLEVEGNNLNQTYNSNNTEPEHFEHGEDQETG